MPPTNDIEAAIDKIMSHFEKEESHKFFDYYDIKGWDDTKGEIIETLNLKQLPGDAIQLLYLDSNTQAHRIIIADKVDDDDIKPVYMTQYDFWNGVNSIRSGWDGTIGSAINMCKEYFESFTYQPKIIKNWLAVTVDYHN